jgi:hypothetical protein
LSVVSLTSQSNKTQKILLSSFIPTLIFGSSRSSRSFPSPFYFLHLQVGPENPEGLTQAELSELHELQDELNGQGDPSGGLDGGEAADKSNPMAEHVARHLAGESTY